MVTLCCAAAAFSRDKSPPGSTNAPRIVAVHHNKVQFCCNGVTGMIVAFSGGLLIPGDLGPRGERDKGDA